MCGAGGDTDKYLDVVSGSKMSPIVQHYTNVLDHLVNLFGGVSFLSFKFVSCFRTVTRKETDRMFEELYTSKELIVIRDVKMCINLQTIDSRINFMSHGESHTLKVIKKGKTVEEEVFDSQEEMFKRVRQLNVRALGP